MTRFLILLCVLLATIGVPASTSPVPIPLFPLAGAAHPMLQIDETDAVGSTVVMTRPTGYTPDDLIRAYHIPRLHGDQGTVVLVEGGHDPTIKADVAHYRSYFGFPPCLACVRVINEYGRPSPLPITNSDWAVETALDADMVTAVCPRCHIVIVEAEDSSITSLLIAEQAAANLHPDAISNSWGTAEFVSPPCTTMSTLYLGCTTNADLVADTSLSFRHPGTVVTVASGDDGYGPTWPADSPDVIAVGGTRLLASSVSPRGFVETVWGASRYGAWGGGGSGCSAYQPKPPWQQDRCPYRTIADVSFVADPATGVAIYDSTPFYGHHHHKWYRGWVTVGGTSAGAPAIAALYALAGNARYMSNGAGPHLYANWRSLNDVTDGTDAISCPCFKGAAYLREATRGYDGPSGAGSPNGLGAF